jgi:hypothetical protein
MNPVPLPLLTRTGDLPIGVHSASLKEVLDRFGTDTGQRKAVGARLEHVYHVARGTGHLARLVVFESFITSKPEPNDVDVFLLMEDTFDASRLTGEAQVLFDHAAAQALFGASVFWLRRLTAFEGEQKTIEYWQVKRGNGRRGIVEIIPEAT